MRDRLSRAGSAGDGSEAARGETARGSARRGGGAGGGAIALAALALAALLLAAVAAAAVPPVTSGFSTEVRPAASLFDAAALFPPRLVTPPAISGTAREGETLTATGGSWARGVDSSAIEWLRCDGDGDRCTVVAEGSTRELAAADVGATLRVRVVATNAGGSSDARSVATSPVGAMAPPRSTAPPSISGTATVGQMLTASAGSWEGGRLSLTRRWLRCTTVCAAIPGEAGESYVVTGDDADATLKAEVTATNAVGSATASSPATPAVGRAAYLHILCRNPRNRAFVGTDGVLPDGLAFASTAADWPSPAPASRCASPGGVPLSTGGTWTTATPAHGGRLQYRSTSGVAFESAVLYRYGQTGGYFSWAVNTAGTTALLVTPRADLCRWVDGCTSLGSSSLPFGDANRVDISRGNVNGFNVVLLCDVPAGLMCHATGAERVVLTGAVVRLRDLATPQVTTPAEGGLVDHATLEPLERLLVGASDAGSGLYRVRVTIDHVEVAAPRVPAAGSGCADADPDAGDAYEFAVRRPCTLSTSIETTFDTTAWPKAGRLRVYLEDAGRNTTVVVNRRLGG